MNHNYQFTQNIYNMGINYPSHISHNLNYLIYLSLNHQNVNNLNSNQVFSSVINENNVLHQDKTPIQQENNFFFNYCHLIPFNYSSFNDYFTINNRNFSTISQNITPVDHQVSLLNSKRNRNDRKIENISKANVDFPAKESTNKKINNIPQEEIIIKENKGDKNKVNEGNIIELYEDSEKNTKKGKINKKGEKAREKVQKQKKIKNGNKKKKMCEELLQDTLLEHIGEKKSNILTSNEETISSVINKPNKKNTNNNNSNKNDEKKIMNNKNQHKKQIKNKICNINYQPTRVIFYGEDYEKTKSMKDFMKYNFNFSVEEQYISKRLIIDYENQHVNIEKMNKDSLKSKDIKDNTLLEIKPKWLRSLFPGNKLQLKKAINLIQDILRSNRSTIDQEKCCDILKSNNYNIEEILKFKCM